MTTFPTITITQHYDTPATWSGAMYCANWETPEARYHVWLDGEGQPDGWLHRNGRGSEPGTTRHRQTELARSSKAVAALQAATTPEALQAAREAFRVKRTDERAEGEKAAHAAAQARFDDLWAAGYRPSVEALESALQAARDVNGLLALTDAIGEGGVS